MKRVSIGAVVGLVVVVGIMLNMPKVVTADPAIVIKNDGQCGMPGADENGDRAFVGIGERTTVIENDNKVMMKCKGVDIPNLSGRAQVFEGFPCGLVDAEGGVIFTEDTHATVAAKGNASMTCIFEK